MPFLVFIAGPNGSGKSTLASSGVLQKLIQSPEDEPPVLINPDAILRDLMKTSPSDRSALEAEAALLADELLTASVESGLTVIRETVLSTDRLQPIVHMARDRGYTFVLLLVLLQSPELNIERVRMRIAQGGHDVPENKIRERWHRSLLMAVDYAALADALLVFDNSVVAMDGAGPVLLIERTSAGLYVAPKLSDLDMDFDVHPDLRTLLQKLSQ